MKKFKLLTLLMGCGFILSSCAGPEGPVGPAGPAGPTGPTGENGKSAYEIYCEAHPEYTGTEEEWLDALINGELGEKEMHTVTFDSNGGTAVQAQSVEHGEKATKPETPTNEDFEFLGWYYEGEPWSFPGYVVTQDITLVAEWGGGFLSKIQKAVSDASESTSGYYVTNNYGETEPTKTTRYEHGIDANGATYMTYGADYNGKMVRNYYAYDANKTLYGYSINEASADKYLSKIGYPNASVMEGPMDFYYKNVSNRGADDLLEIICDAYTNNPNNVRNVTGDTLYVEEPVELYGSTTLWQFTCEFVWGDHRLDAFQVTTRSYYSHEISYDAEFNKWYVNESVDEKSPTIYRFVLEYGYPKLMLPYNVDAGDFEFADFDFVGEDGVELAQNITIEVGEKNVYNLKNGSPRQASADFDTPVITKAAGATGNVNASFNSYSGRLEISADKVGEVELTIKTANVTKTVNVTVNPATATGVRFATYVKNQWNDKYSCTVMSENKVEFYAGKETAILGPQVMPLLAEQGHTFVSSSTDLVVTKLDSKITSNLDVGNYNYKDVEFDAYKLSGTVPGTYTVTATSTADPSITEELTVVIKAIPAVDEIVSSDYWHYVARFGNVSTNIYLAFTPDTADASVGTVEIKNYIGVTDPVVTTYDYTYNATTATFALAVEGVASTLSLQVTDTFDGIKIVDSNTESPSNMNGYTLKKYSVMPYLAREWGMSKDFGNKNLSIYDDGRTIFNYAVTTYITVEENIDGTLTLVFPQDALDDIAEILEFDSVTSFVVAADYKTMTMTYVKGGETLTTQLS